MVKFSDISKLWKDPEEEPQEEGKSKKAIHDKNESPRSILPVHHGGSAEGMTDRHGQLKTPEVPQARLIKISNIPEKKPPETVKGSVAQAESQGDTIGSPQVRADALVTERKVEISFRNIGAGARESAPTEPKLNISEVIKQDDKMAQAASELYDRLYIANQNVINLINGNASNRIDIRELIQLIKEAVAFMESNQPALVGFAYRDPRQDYFIAHQINVVILSLAIGSGLGYRQNQLEELGLVAFLHDVAMQELPGVVDTDEQKKAVVGNEVIKSYIKSGMQILRQIPFLPAVILEVCRQYHENYHGGGSGLVHEYAQIMRMADSFETLTHYRPNRVTKTAQSALRELIDAADTDFARKVLKILIKQVGIYPVGTFVLLNTQEIGEVFKNNDNFPLRPVINVLHASDDKFSVLRTVDLLTNPGLYITGTINREDALARAKPEGN